MRALRAHDLGGPTGLRIDQVPVPGRPDPQAVRIDVHAAGLGFVDTLVIRGKYQVRQSPPFTPGLEVSGVVSDAPVSSPLTVGQRVSASLISGGCAETIWAAAHRVAPLPAGLSFVEGASMVVNHHTAVVALTRRAGLQPGERVLVHGAGGGLGSAFVQVAAALGADVWAVAGSPERRAVARVAGARIDYGPDDWFDAVRAAGGADVIVDPVGGDVFEQSVRCVAAEGRLLTLGFTSGRIGSVAANRLLLRNGGVLGVNWTALLEADDGLFRRTAHQLDALVAAGLRPVALTQYDLPDAAAAFEDLESRRLAGKAVVVLR